MGAALVFMTLSFSIFGLFLLVLACLEDSDKETERSDGKERSENSSSGVVVLSDSAGSQTVKVTGSETGVRVVAQGDDGRIYNVNITGGGSVRIGNIKDVLTISTGEDGRRKS